MSWLASLACCRQRHLDKDGALEQGSNSPFNGPLAPSTQNLFRFRTRRLGQVLIIAKNFPSFLSIDSVMDLHHRRVGPSPHMLD